MSPNPTSLQALFAEMKRRRVFRVMAVYGVVAFMILQIADLVFPILELPDWTLQLVLMLALLGFPIAIVLAWAFEQTPEGLKRTEDAAPGEIEQIVAQPLSRRVPSGLLALAGVLLLVGGAWWMGKRSGEGADLNLSVPAAQASDFRTIAVLPFQNVGDDEENEVLASGLHMDLQASLSQIAELRVTSPYSVKEYAATDKGVREIGAELAVDHVLQGSVRRSGDMARVDVQLIDVATSTNLWVEQFDEAITPDNLFQIQSSIARQVAERLQAELTPADFERFDAGPATENLAALTWYQRAREAAMELGRGGRQREALEYAEQAVRLDPDFAEAWSLLAIVRAWFTGSGEDLADEALAAVERAEALAPGSIEALKARAAYESEVSQDYPTALSLVRQAERLAPSDAEIVQGLGELQRTLGDWPEAARTLKRAVSLDPKNTFVLNTLGMTLQLLGRYEAADRVTERVLQLDASDQAARSRKVALTYAMDGDPRRARSLAAELGLDAAAFEEGLILTLLAVDARDYEEAERVAALIPRDTLYLLETNRLWLRGAVRQASGGDPMAFGDSLLAIEGNPEGLGPGVEELVEAAANLMVGNVEMGRRRMAEGIRISKSSGEAWMAPQVKSFSAQMYAAFGMEEEALEQLDEVIETPGYGVPSAAALSNDPSFDALRDDPRFQTIVQRRRAFEAQAARDAEADGPWLP